MLLSEINHSEKVYLRVLSWNQLSPLIFTTERHLMWFPSRATSAMPRLQAPQCNGLARRPRFIIHRIVLEVDPSFIDVKNARSIWSLSFLLVRALKIRESMN